MKKQSFLSGLIFLGFGIYFILDHFNFSLFQDFYTWPTLLTIIGLGFLGNGYLGKEYESILPGIILTGLGIHFHIASQLDVWPDHAGIFLLLIALGILLRYVKTGTSLVQGILFLAAAILILFFDRLTEWAQGQGHQLTILTNIWPFFFIIAGVFFLLRKKK